MTSTTDTILMDIQAAIQAAETILPTVLGVVGVFSPGAKAIIPFLPLLQVALQTVQQVQAVIDADVEAAVSSVTSTLQAAPTAAAPAPAATPAQ